MRFLLNWLITAIAVGVAVWLVPGIGFLGGTETWVALAAVGLMLGLIDAILKPILQLLSLPITFITLGIFYLVVNTFLLYCAAWMANGIFGVGFQIDSFGSAFVAGIVISITSAILQSVTGAKDPS